MFISKRCIAILVLLAASISPAAIAQTSQRVNSLAGISATTLLRIIKAEDARNWNDDLKTLLSDVAPKVRQRAALAAGRIGDERAVPPLAEMLLTDRDSDVRQMAAFALGEIESPGGAYALLQILKPSNANDLITPVVRARALEAMGKITAAMPANAPPTNQPSAAKSEDDRLDRFREAILETLRLEDSHRAQADRLTILLGLTAVLRAKPEGAGPVLIKFLDYSDASIVAAALNTRARMRLKDAPEQVRQLLNHSDPIVRANAARVIGAAEDKGAFVALLDRALHDPDLRVRVSAIRALGSLKDARAIEPLKRRAEQLWWKAQNEMLELSAALGNLATVKGDDSQLRDLIEVARHDGLPHPEFQIAAARIDPKRYLNAMTESASLPLNNPFSLFRKWRFGASVAQGLGAMSNLKAEVYGANLSQVQADAQKLLKRLADDPHLPTLAMPEIMRAYLRFRNSSPGDFLTSRLQHRDVIVRATAAELLGEQPPSLANTRALVEALPRALHDKDLNDAALAILDALGKQKNQAANDAIKTALDSDDHLIRRKAVALLKANGIGDFSDRIGTVKTRNTDVDYRRAIARIDKHVTATVVTNKGSFTIEFLSDDAPLTVDNFIQLAKRGFFNGQTIPRVVPNFVIQAGDPRGDTNGGPGYQIRCEINEVPYERGAVGMALSGKDTGGSQWFVTHSPQPHLDGGYTVFGHVVRGMDVVDSIARGDVIRRVIVSER